MSEMTVKKVLSANDTGETGAHQAGILVPKDKHLLQFFPQLNPLEYNPRVQIIFTDEEERSWMFAFIYYNNKKFGGTRNEYRLTRMTNYIREAALVEGDQVILSRNDKGCYSIKYNRMKYSKKDIESVLKLSTGWRIIDI